MEQQPIVKQAAQAFESGRYHTALDLYKKAASVFGKPLFDVNIVLCERRLDQDQSIEQSGNTNQPISLEEQLHNTQQLLEYYYTRSQELEYQLLDK